MVSSQAMLGLGCEAAAVSAPPWLAHCVCVLSPCAMFCHIEAQSVRWGTSTHDELDSEVRWRWGMYKGKGLGWWKSSCTWPQHRQACPICGATAGWGAVSTFKRGCCGRSHELCKGFSGLSGVVKDAVPAVQQAGVPPALDGGVA